MEPVTIHIATQSRYVKFFVWLTKLFGGGYSVEAPQKPSLRDIIERGEREFAEGKHKVMTIKELRAMTNEVA